MRWGAQSCTKILSGGARLEIMIRPCHETLQGLRNFSLESRKALRTLFDIKVLGKACAKIFSSHARLAACLPAWCMSRCH